MPLSIQKILESNVPEKVDEDVILFTDEGNIYVNKSDGTLLKMGSPSVGTPNEYPYNLFITPGAAKQFSAPVAPVAGGGISFKNECRLVSIDVVIPQYTTLTTCSVFTCLPSALTGTGLIESHESVSLLCSIDITDSPTQGSLLQLPVNGGIIKAGYALWVSFYGTGIKHTYSPCTVYPSAIKSIGYNWNGSTIYSDGDIYPMSIHCKYK